MKRITTLRFYFPVTFLLLCACGRNSQTGNQHVTEKYATITVKLQDATLESTYPVTLKGREDTEIRSRVDGYIEEIYVDEGSFVKEGQALFKIQSPSSEQTLRSAKAEVYSAQALLKTAQLDVERYRPLAAEDIVSEVQLKTYENSYESALASLEQAKANLMNAEATMAWTTVTSPITGVIGEIAYRTGSLVGSSTTLTTVSSIRKVYANFSMNEKKLQELLDHTEGTTQDEKIKNLPEVSLLLTNGDRYERKGKIETITGTIDANTGSANLRVEFDNDKGRLRSGLSGKVVIPKVLEGVYVIPQSTTFAQQDKVFVYKVQSGELKQQIITVKEMPNGQDYAVLAGLNEGDEILSEALTTAYEGMKVSTQNEASHLSQLH